jgi:hypothetical protein
MNVRLALPLVALFTLGGCVILKTPHTSSKSSTKKSGLSSRPECKPSQYWDGERCVHKGKGKGARKHDD